MLASFRLAHYHLTLEALEPLHLPPFKGSALRGGFGHTFKRLVCFSPKGTHGQSQLCGKRCELGNACPYGYVFETTPPDESEVLSNLSEVPRPFVIEPPDDRREHIPPGERLTFGLTLVGRGINYLPYFIAVFRELGKIGLGRPFDTAQGRQRGKYRLLAMDAISTLSPNPSPFGPLRSPSQGEGSTPFPYEGVPSAVLQGGSTQGRGGGAAPSPYQGEGWGEGGDTIIPIYRAEDDMIRTANTTISGEAITAHAAALPADHITLNFLTPTRLKHRGHWVDEGPPFHILVKVLLGRVSSLSYFHCGHKLEADFRGLIDRAAEVRIAQSETGWRDWSRFSGRQKQRVEMGGLVGQVTYSGDLRDYLPLLALGELVHVGKGTVFGNGQYRIVGSVGARSRDE
jgi:hypothetical protein